MSEAVSQGRAFRPDIEGLRAVSVMAVIAYHAFPALLPGGFTGVDVFFVISGYLITRLLASEWAERGRIDLVAFWARRIRRILPIASLVLVVTIGVILLIPALDARALAPHAIAAALFVHNFHQAREATDYFGASHAENPLLHYWSLSVEEQFYLAWPLLLVGLLMAGRRRGGRGLAVGGAALLVLLSLAFNLWLTARDPAWAFFHPAARAWQLGLGATLALGEPFLIERLSRARRAVAIGLASIGALGLAASLAVLSSAVPYPGAAALFPTLSGLVLIAAHSLAPTPIRLFLSSAPMRLVGRLSFGWYLWHWPTLVFGRLVLTPTVTGDLILIALSFLLALASFHLVEAPIRNGVAFQSPRWRAYALGVGLVGSTLALGIATRHLAPDLIRLADGQYASARAIKADRAVIYGDGCALRFQVTAQPPCVYGAVNASRAVVLVGDSHAGNWFAPLDEAAREEGWRLIARVKSSCPPVDAPARVTEAGRERDFPECVAWRAATFAEIETMRPALIIVGSTRHGFPVEAELAVLSRFAKVAPTLVMRGTPWLMEDAVTCLRRARDPDQCQWPLADLLVPYNFPRTPPERMPPGVHVIDLNERLCPNGVCRAILEGRVMMFDNHHLTASASRALAPIFRELLRARP